MTQAAEQFLSSAKSTMTDLNGMTSTTLAGFGKLMELNMATAQAAMSEAAEQMQAGLAIKSPQDLSAVTGLALPVTERAVAYGRAVAGIVTETGAALTKATEAKFADMQAQAVAGIEAAMKNAPAGSEGAVSAFRTAMATGQAALATTQSQAKHAMETVGKQFATASEMAVKATRTASKTK